MGDQMDWANAARYLAGEGSASEREQFEAWMAGDPARTELIDSLRPLMARTTVADQPVNTEEAWQKLEARTRDPIPAVADGGVRRRGFPYGFLIPAAAAAALLIAAGVGMWMENRPTEALLATQQLATRVGERRAVTLQGGTRVVLAPATTMIVTTANGSARSVRLSGEAYFTVVHDDRQSFSVYTSGVVVRDIGTRFSVRAVPESGRTEVVVAEGTVEMRNTIGADSTKVIIHAGETAASENGHVSAVIPADIQRSLGWLRGELVFADAPLPTVANELQRWYGVPVRVEGSALRSRTLTVTFVGETLDEALAVIGRTLGVRYEREPGGQGFVIRER